ncbi:hypothetical protein [Endozoicomonas sp. 8E]|uniref:hypothetical protein n=1 Tax=Endozoicomonas sp. 8E TaxID=3035692 RepID=UPI002938E72D|nr:hypothetical protein [Endozoicomonas sp. 8E]WOG28173.1 hypothetical protein P6910_00540 [Endozoicomonas sp. 8E]
MRLVNLCLNAKLATQEIQRQEMWRHDVFHKKTPISFGFRLPKWLPGKSGTTSPCSSYCDIDNPGHFLADSLNYLYFIFSRLIQENIGQVNC